MEIYYMSNPDKDVLRVDELIEILEKLPGNLPIMVENGTVESIKVDNFFPEYSDRDDPYVEIL